jgi:hypothetical protein
MIAAAVGPASGCIRVCNPAEPLGAPDGPLPDRDDAVGRKPGGERYVRERASLMEGLAQGAAKVPLGIRGRLIEAEGSRISTPCDTRQHNEAMDSLVVDAEAGMRIRKLGGHLSGHLGQPGQQERRNVVELSL